MLLDMIKKITGQNRPEEVPLEILQLLCDLETLRFNPPIDIPTIEEALNSPVENIDDTAAYVIFDKCKIYLFSFPFYQGNIYLGEYVDRISLSNFHPDSEKTLDTESPKNLPEAFLDRIAFLKAARLLAEQDQSKIFRADEGFSHVEVDITYLANF